MTRKKITITRAQAQRLGHMAFDADGDVVIEGDEHGLHAIKAWFVDRWTGVEMTYWIFTPGTFAKPEDVA